MKTCDQCKWWKAPNYKYEYDEGENHGECLMASGEDDCATVSNGEPYNSGTLSTGPKFGCIHWEKKDES